MLLNPDFSPLNRNNVFVDRTSSLASWDAGFANLHRFASRFVRVPSAILTRSRNVDVLAQHLGDDVPTVVIYPHRCLAKQAIGLACSEPYAWIDESGDLQSSEIALSWTIGPYELILPEYCIEKFINEQFSLDLDEECSSIEHCKPNEGHIAFVFVTPDRTAIQLLKIDEDFIHGLQGAKINTGLNYVPTRFHSEHELAAAQHNGPRFYQSQFHWDGRARLELAILDLGTSSL